VVCADGKVVLNLFPHTLDAGSLFSFLGHIATGSDTELLSVYLSYPICAFGVNS